MCTWEANNNITADGGIRHVAPDVVDDAGVSRSRVATLHSTQDVVVTGLEGDVEEFTQLG